MSWTRPLCPSERPLTPILATNNPQDQFRHEISRLNKAWKRREPFSPVICLLLQGNSTVPTLRKCYLVASLVFVFPLACTAQCGLFPLLYQAFLLGYRNLSACFYLRRGLAFSRIGTGLLRDVPRGRNLHTTPE